MFLTQTYNYCVTGQNQLLFWSQKIAQISTALMHCSAGFSLPCLYPPSLLQYMLAPCPLPFFSTKYNGLSLPWSDSLAAHFLFIYRGHLALKPACHGACRDRAVAASQLLCHQLWPSSSTFSCQPFLPASSAKGEKTLSSTRPICCVPYRYILKECVKTANYAYKQEDFLLGSSP